MRFAIVDDDMEIHRCISDQIQKILSKFDIAVSIDCFQSASDFLAVYQSDQYSALFLDIDMPQQDGFALTQSLRERNDSTLVIYITNRDDLVFRAFRFSAIGFVRKQHMDSELPYAISTLLETIRPDKKTIIVTELLAKGGCKRSIVIASILYIESHNHEAVIHLTDGVQITVRKPLYEFASQAGFEHFVYINSGTIVNLVHAELSGSKIIFPGHPPLFISKRRMAEVRKVYLSTLQKVLL